MEYSTEPRESKIRMIRRVLTHISAVRAIPDALMELAPFRISRPGEEPGVSPDALFGMVPLHRCSAIRNNSILRVNIGERQLNLLDQENINYNAPVVGYVFYPGRPGCRCLKLSEHPG